MKNSIYKIQKSGLYLVPILFFFAFLSCESLEVETPTHLLSGETLFTDPNTAEAAIISIYAKMRESGFLSGGSQGLSNLMGNYADEIEYYSPNRLAEEQFYKNTLSPEDLTVAAMWDTAYNNIYAANAIIEGVAGSAYFTPEEQALFTGEALFIRALIHFYLVNLYGDIPYITTTNYIENSSVSRDPEPVVYEAIIADLQKAVAQLPETDASGERLRPTSYTAAALLARVYLYTENWELAQQYASRVIDNTGWEPNIENVFLKTSASTLWQFSPNDPGLNTYEAATFIVLSAPPAERALSNEVVNDFEEGDLRLTNWVGEITDGTTTWYYPFKYKVGQGATNTEEYSIVMREAEQYLIRAEARARMGDVVGAQADINKIRARAGLANTNASSESELLTAIIHERRVELFTEHGHRFFDLKRTNKLDAVLGPVKPGWNATDALLPLPQKELVANPNLQPQNPGY